MLPLNTLVLFVLTTVGVGAYGIKKLPKPQTIIPFSKSSSFTWYRKWTISKSADAYRDYLVEIGFDLPKRTPPLSLSKDWLLSGGPGGGSPYYSHMTIREKDLNKPDDAVALVYGNYLFEMFLSSNQGNNKDAEFRPTAVRLLSDYYRCSFTGKRVNFSPYPAEIDKWESDLWALRTKYGPEFMDQAMFFSIKRWQPYGFTKDDVDFNGYFASRVEIGAAALDNNTYPTNEIHEFFTKESFFKKP